MINKRIAILTGGYLDSLKAKMANGVMRFRNDVIVVIDERHTGKTVDMISHYVNKKIPIVGTIEEALKFDIDELLIGIAPPNGEIPKDWIDIIYTALCHNVKIVNGLHERLANSSYFPQYGEDKIQDLRFQKYSKKVAAGKAAELKNNVILTVGSDCASGKMTTALELQRACLNRGLKAGFVATGQTGMYIADSGIAIDAVVSDFISGVVEEKVCESSEENDFVFVEGQGSLVHPSYSGVSLGLLHGAAPNIVIFCHDIARNQLAYYNKNIPSLEEQIQMVEKLANYQRKCRVLGISLFAENISSAELNEVIFDMEKKYRMPVFAPLMTGCEKMVQILEEFK